MNVGMGEQPKEAVAVDGPGCCKDDGAAASNARADTTSRILEFLDDTPVCDCASDDLTYQQHLIAGAVAGITEHCSMFPIDTIKTRLQIRGTLNAPHYTGMRDVCHHIAYTEGAGFRGFFRGVTAMALGAGPSHAIYFAVYENLRVVMGADAPGHHPLANGVAGGLGTMVGDGIFAPMDTVKQRLQVHDSPYRNVPDVMIRMVREEGVGSLFASYRTTLLMNVPFTIAQFGSYNSFKEIVGANDFNPGSAESVAAHWMCGGASGAIAAVLTNPLDVIRTAIQTQGLQGRLTPETRYTSILEVGREIIARDGVKGMARGWLPRMLYHMPGAAICWTTYEYMKDLFERGHL